MNHHRLFLVISALPWLCAMIPSSLYGQCGGCGAGSGASGSAAGPMKGPLNQSTDAGLVNPSGSAQNVTFGESTATIPPGSNKASFTNEVGRFLLNQARPLVMMVPPLVVPERNQTRAHQKANIRERTPTPLRPVTPRRRGSRQLITIWTRQALRITPRLPPHLPISDLAVFPRHLWA